MSKDYDLVVLGTGGAGNTVAITARQAGWKVAVIDDGIFGGTCATRGCVPKKVLAGTAEIIDFDQRLGGLGIITVQPTLSWPALIQHKRTFTDHVPQETIKQFEEAGIDVYKGSPHFSGNIEITVNDHVLKTKKAHIAVGAKPAKLPMDGAQYLITSDQFFELEHLPRHIVFVGGGYVSFELAHIAARFHAKVTILHKDDRPLNQFDNDMIQNLMTVSKEAGIGIELNANVKRIEKHNGGFRVLIDNGKHFDADLVVHGAGRPPDIADLNLDAVHVVYDKYKGIQVDDYLQTTNPDIYAAGDAAAGHPPLSPVASSQGKIVADNLFGKRHKKPSYLSTPSVVFTTPPVAKVGLLEEEARSKNLSFEVIKKDLSNWLDNKRINIKHAASKILIEKETNKIIGAHIIGHHAEEVINIFSLAMELGLTTDQLKQPIFAFPTALNDMRSMF